MCPHCRGQLHVRVAGTETYKRCSCTQQVLSLSYIRPDIRIHDETPQPGAIVPLRDVFVCEPSLTRFRHAVWRSLLVYEPQSLVYEYQHTFALVTAYFDPENRALPALQQVALLVLVGGVSEVPHSLLGPLTLQTLRVRAQAGLPTWVYMPSLQLLKEFYGGDAVTYLTPLLPPGTYEPPTAPSLLVTPTLPATVRPTGRIDPTAV